MSSNAPGGASKGTAKPIVVSGSGKAASKPPSVAPPSVTPATKVSPGRTPAATPVPARPSASPSDRTQSVSTGAPKGSAAPAQTGTPKGTATTSSVKPAPSKSRPSTSAKSPVQPIGPSPTGARSAQPWPGAAASGAATATGAAAAGATKVGGSGATASVPPPAVQPTGQVPVMPAAPAAARTASVGGMRVSATTGRQTPGATSPSKRIGPRRVHLSVAKIDILSVLKLSFFVAFGIGIGIVVLAIVLWLILDGMQVFAQLNDFINTVLGPKSDGSAKFNLNDYVELSKVISVASIIAVIDVVLITLLSTLGAFLYNIVSALVGGLKLTLTDD